MCSPNYIQKPEITEQLLEMGKTNILNTRTINYMELIGNGRSYSVPPYQRDYSWSEEEWEDLWNDIAGLTSGVQDHHFMGSLVIQGKSDREFLVIDGQQRLATLSLFALAIISKLNMMADEGVEPDSNKERAQQLRNRFIGEKDPASLTESTRLVLNHTDNSFYQDCLVQRRLPKSNNLLWKCFLYFRERLDESEDLKTDGEVVAGILSESVARQLLFILITVDDELNAYTVFETLNARGLELTTTDLLKNYLFSLVQVPADLEALQHRWTKLISIVSQERFTEFLRYHLLCKKSTVRSNRLFKLIRDITTSEEDVFVLLDELEGRAELFAAFSDPNHAYWMDLPNAKPYIREICLFRVRQMLPLIFATWEVFSKKDFVRTLKLLSVTSFRYNVVSHLNTNVLERVYPNAARAVIDQDATSPADVFKLIKPVYVDDEKMYQDFSLLVIPPRGLRRKLAKYILARLEQNIRGRSCDFETDPGTIEHIFPENPVGAWQETFPLEIQESSVYRLGNLTLLESSANKKISNATYDEKCEVYKNSAYELTKELPEIAPEIWTPELVNKRQQRLAERAVHLWRSDFV